MDFFTKPLKIFVTAGAVALVMVGCGGAPSGGGSGSITSETITISFEEQSADALALRGRGGEEISVVRFAAKNLDGVVVDGVTVDFEISSSFGGARLLNDSGTTDSDGLVSVAVQSGSLPVAVFVTAYARGTDSIAVSDEIQMSTGDFIASRFTLSVESGDNVRSNLNAIEIDGAAALANIEVTLQIVATDQFGHKVRDGARVTFITPATGLIEPSTCSLVGGRCTTTWSSTESSPVGTEIIVMAHANGAESFIDANANNIYDLGETFIDLPEPFVDINGNGVFDGADVDTLVDRDGDGVWDSVGNGVWDGPCLQSDESLCVGESSTIIWSSTLLRLLGCPDDDCTDL